jgi:hypothetical protein
MKKITGELREWINQNTSYGINNRSSAWAIADRIDRELQVRLLRKDTYWESVIEYQHKIIDETNANYIELPRDKNGNPIRIGDKTCNGIVTGLVIDSVAANAVLYDGINLKKIKYDWAEEVAIIEPDTQEKIDADMEALLTSNLTLGERMMEAQNILCRQHELSSAMIDGRLEK